METPTHWVEFETMLLGRYFIMTARAKGDGSHLDSSSYVLLTGIGAAGPMSLRQLSEAFGLDVSTLNRKTAALVADGLLERIPDADGGIARKFQLSDRGRRRLAKERAEIVAGLTTVLEDWSAGEIADFAAYLRRFNTSIERVSGRAWPRSAAQAESAR